MDEIWIGALRGVINPPSTQQILSDYVNFDKVPPIRIDRRALDWSNKTRP